MWAPRGRRCDGSEAALKSGAASGERLSGGLSALQEAREAAPLVPKGAWQVQQRPHHHEFKKLAKVTLLLGGRGSAQNQGRRPFSSSLCCRDVGDRWIFLSRGDLRLKPYFRNLILDSSM